MVSLFVVTSYWLPGTRFFNIDHAACSRELRISYLVTGKPVTGIRYLFQLTRYTNLLV